MSSLRRLGLGLLLVPSLATVAWAKSWCARPLVVHEWGVQVFDPRGVAEGPRGGATLPPFFHERPGATSPPAARVADLPADGGERDLPVLHFTARDYDDRIPVAIGVGFSAGAATHWYPQVDAFRSESAANSPAALAIRRGLVAARAELKAFGPRPHLPDDPTRQLEWRSLVLSSAPLHAAPSTDVAWVKQARALPGALWVNTATESERFVFFEGKTREKVALRLERGNTYTNKTRHYVLQNTGNFAVHDVFVVHREGDALFVFNAPAIPAGASAGFVLEEHRVPPAQRDPRTIGALRRQLVGVRTEDTTCVMGRDPAIPIETAAGHSLFAGEAELLLGVWSSALFSAQGTTIVYREDPGYLDRVMPLSIHTDMWHWVELHRTGLALWRGVVLP